LSNRHNSVFGKFLRRFLKKATADPTREALVARRNERNTPFGAFLLLAFLLRLLHQKKSGNRFKESLYRERGTPTCELLTSLSRSTPHRKRSSPSFRLWRKFTLRGALEG
jgi:hypothetical protein